MEKEDAKTTFMHNMVVFLEYPNETTEKLCAKLRKFSKLDNYI